MVDSSRQSEVAIEPIASFSVLLSRVAWCFGGPVALAFLTLKIAFSQDGWGSPSDVAFPLVLAATIAARWISFRNGDRLNTFGEVTTLNQLRRYSVVFLCAGVVVWIATNMLANHVLN
jgi:hypothetical protein